MANLQKNATAGKGTAFTYKYTDLAQVNTYIEELGETYYQYVETTENGVDYVHTVRQMKDGTTLDIKGVRIISGSLKNSNNPAQDYGSGLTYARRYSLYMAYGLATEDDDGARVQPKAEPKKAQTPKSEPKKAEPKQQSQPKKGLDEMTYEEKLTALKGLVEKMNTKKEEFMSGLDATFGVKNLDDIELKDINEICTLAKNVVLNMKEGD